MPNYPLTDEVLLELIDKFDVCNPNTGDKLTLESFYGFFRMNDMDKRLTLISLIGMSEMNGYSPAGNKQKMLKAMKNYDG